MTAIIEEIRRQLAQNGRWELPADRVRELLGIDHAAFYRRIYEQAMQGHPLLDVSLTTRSFEQENVGELVSLLELFVGDEAERRLDAAGLFFSHSERFEITSRFLRRTGEASREHSPRRDVFTAMLRRFGSYRKARRAYLDEYFSMHEFIEQTAREYVRSRRFEFPDVAEANVRGVLEEYFRRHVLERETVLASVCARLFDIAVLQGFERRPEDEWAEEEAARGYRRSGARQAGRGGWGRGAGHEAGAEARPEESRSRWARRIMELGDEKLTVSALKRKYKALMKRYHPDVNPGGLRACQRINEAYNLLLAAAPDSP
jgi:hypothetical protein